jgi:hypothetical protein
MHAQNWVLRATLYGETDPIYTIGGKVDKVIYLAASNPNTAV